MVKFVFPFLKRVKDGETYKEPKIPVILKGSAETIEQMMHIDTGSTVSYLPLEIAETLGFDPGECEKTTAEGMGGTEDVGEFKVDMKIVRKNRQYVMRDVPVLVFLKKDIRWLLLGLDPLFQKFDVLFKLQEGKIELNEVPLRMIRR